jgi:hypothetical protein
MENLAFFLRDAVVLWENFYSSNFFAILKFLLGIYAIVVLLDIILLLVQRGLGGDIRSTLFGTNIPPELISRKSNLRKKWNKIRMGLENENESVWKETIIEADQIIGDLIERMGYPGENLEEKLAMINPGKIENIGELREAHKIKNQIVREKSFQLEKKQAKEIMGYYENFLKYFEVL